MRLGATIPNFDANTTKGPINFYEWQGDSWCVMFSHPSVFTPVCTTEIGAIASYSNEFKKRGVKVITLSCEKLDSHLDWNADINSYCNIPEDFPYPMVADETRELAIKLDLIDENSKDNPKEAKMVRAVYIIAPDHTVKMLMMYPGLAGRNVDEILRVIDSLQLTSRLKVVATPANWTPGTKVLILPRVKDEELPELFPKGVEKVNLPSGRSYVRTTTDY